MGNEFSFICSKYLNILRNLSNFIHFQHSIYTEEEMRVVEYFSQTLSKLEFSLAIIIRV